MYFILLCMAISACALPVPDELPIRNTYSPLIITDAEKILRTNLLATFLVPFAGAPYDYGLKQPLIQIERKTHPKIKDVDPSALTDPKKICDKATELNELPLFPLPVLSSGSGTFTLTDEEPEVEKVTETPEKERPELAESEMEEMSEPTELKEPVDTEPEEIPEPAELKEPMVNEPEEISEPAEPKEPMDTKPEEVPEPLESTKPDTEPEELPEKGEELEELAELEPSPTPAPVIPVSPILTPAAPEVPKPKPPIFNFKPPFLSYFFPSWYSGKSGRFSLSSLPLLSTLNLQDLPDLTSSTLSNLGLSSSTLSNLGHPSLPTDGASWLTLLPFLNNRDKVEAPRSRLYLYVRPTTGVK